MTATRRRRVILALLGVWLALETVLAVMVYSYGFVDHVHHADAIIVLGAGLRRDNMPTPSFRIRVAHGAELWHQGFANHIICTGGTPGFATISEAEVCRDMLMNDHNVPIEAIILEDQSRSTAENALFSRSIMVASGWHTAVVVSDGYHLFRAKRLFTRVGVIAYTSPASTDYLSPFQYAGSLAREVAALQWQAVIDALNLPFTYVPLV
jgi:uncharacterized SAM-binding protein YcdF (DUF218 family)